MSDSDDDDDIAYMALVALLSDELEAPNRPRRSDGLAAMALLNFPGSWHDGAIAWCGFYQAVKALDALGFKLVGDSAFRANLQALLVCDKDTTVLPPRGPLLTAHMEQQAAIKSVRQAAEWGMGTPSTV